jgi:rSAM/selenodomain-associated transferase 1
LIVHALATARAAAIGPVELWCAPDCTDASLRDCARTCGATLCTQIGANLGERMRHAFEHALSTARGAVLIGTDCPVLGARHLRDAKDALAAGVTAACCPAEDGGYTLIALARCDARLFDGVRWGEASVMAETRARLRALGWRWRELETLWDVDRPEDYRRLLHSGVLDVRK